MPLGGNNRLAKDSVAKLWLEGRRPDEIDPVADELAKLPLQSDETKEGSRANEPNRDRLATPKAFSTGRFSRSAFRMSSRRDVEWTVMDLVSLALRLPKATC